MKNIQPYSELNITLQSDRNLLIDTALQLEKDLRRSGWMGTFLTIEEISIENLNIFITSILSEYLNTNTEHFFRFIYIVDLPETKVKQSLQAYNSIEAISQMVICRECTKIILRNKLK